MRNLAFLGVFLLAGLAAAMQEVVAPRVRVIFASPELEPFAQRVASEAERALDALQSVFELLPVTVVVVEDTDLYNAVAPPLPRPRTVLPALFPNDADLGYRAEDDLYLLLVHELTHNLQLGYAERPDGSPPRLGLVGERVAAVPASWFLEGVAVWAESAFSRGGRGDDALTVGLRRSAALEDAWPSLSDASVITFSGWPGGLTRYLYGGGFTGYLVERYGIAGMRAALRAHNAGGPLSGFAHAWREAVGADLEAEWQAWRAEERAAARARAERAHAGVRRTDTGWYTRAPALSPEGGRLAWVSWPDGIVVADIGDDDARLDERRLVKADRFPRQLGWLDESTLVYARLVRRPGSDFSELFALEVETGREVQLTEGARAKLPSVSPEGCVLYVRDVVTEGSKLKRWCEGDIETLWLAPEGQHIVGVAAGPKIALSLWRPGGYVDIGLLEGGTFHYLTQDRAQNLEPAWQGEGRLVFRSDYDSEAFDLYELELDTRAIRRLTRTVGGAFQPLAGVGNIWYVELGASGYDLAELLEPLDEAPLAPSFEELPVHLRPIARYPVRDYSPWPDLLPYGWLPTDLNFDAGGAGLALSVFGQDDAGLHNYELTAGYDSRLTGQLSGGYLNLRYGYRENTLLQAFQRPEPLSFALRLGLWPHGAHLRPRLETALGVKGELSALLPLDLWTASLRLEAGLVQLASFGAWQPELRLDAALSYQRSDLWGYLTRGWRFGLTGLTSATEFGASSGVWAEVSYVQPLRPLELPGRLILAARGGYRMAPPLPLRLGPWAAVASLGYGHSLPLAWRYGDGLYAAERLSLEPKLHLWFDENLGVGAELGVFFDTVVHYGAPIAVGLSLGYSGGFWYRLGYRLPL